MIVLVLQEVAMERGTINYTARCGGQGSEQAAQKLMRVHQLKLCSGFCAMEEDTT